MQIWLIIHGLSALESGEHLSVIDKLRQRHNGWRRGDETVYRLEVRRVTAAKDIADFSGPTILRDDLNRPAFQLEHWTKQRVIKRFTVPITPSLELFRDLVGRRYTGLEIELTYAMQELHMGLWVDANARLPAPDRRQNA